MRVTSPANEPIDFDDARAGLGDAAVAFAVNGAKPVAAEHMVAATPYIWRDPESIEPRNWVYGRSILRGHVRLIVAQGGAGKTILSIGEALAMVTGRDFLGQTVHGGPKRVWLWNLEDDLDEIGRAIQAACKHWNIKPTDIDGRLFVDSALEGSMLKLATSGPDGFSINRPLVDDLTHELKTRRIDYLHVDPFVSSHSVNENDNMEIDTVAKEWASVAKLANAAIGLAHHVSKVGAAEATALSARGASALVNAARSAITINRMSDDEARRYGIEDERRRRYFRVYDDKNNRAPPSDKSDWFHLHSVDLCNGGDLPGDNMGVVVPWSPPDAFDGVTVDHLYRVQCAVSEGRWRESNQSTEWVGHAVANVMGLRADKDAKSDRARISTLLRSWYANGALVIVEGKDDSRRPRQFVEVGQWAVERGAPPASSGVEQGGASGAPKALRSTPPPVRGGGVAGGAAVNNQGGAESGVVRFPAERSRCPILAPGESVDDPVPGAFGL